MGLLSKFTKRARQVLSMAQEEARHFNHPYVGTEHLLLGLIRDQEGVAGKVLDDLGVELQQARSAVEFVVGHGEGPPRSDEVELTARAKKVIEYAVEESRRLHHHYIGAEHLLLGLVRNGEGVATGVLEILGVSLGQLREQVLSLISPASAGRSSGPAGAEQANGPAEGPTVWLGGTPALFPAEARQSAEPGTAVTYALALTNVGRRPEVFQLAVETAPGPLLPDVYTGLKQTTIRLDAGQTVEFDVIVFVPGSVTSGVDARRVRATAVAREEAAAEAVITTTVNP